MLKLPPRKLELIIPSMKIFPLEAALYVHESTVQPCMGYCCHAWAVACNCYLELLNKLQKWRCRNVGPLLAASFEPIAHCQNVASLRLLYRYYFDRCSSELAELVPPLILERDLLVILIDCIIFPSQFLDVRKMSMATVFFSHR